MSYCKNCGAKLQNGARFCALCGTPAEGMTPDVSVQGNAGAPNGSAETPVQGNTGAPNGSAGMQPYPGTPVQGNAGAPSGSAGMQPYPGTPVQGNTGAPNGSAGMQPYPGTPVQGNTGAPNGSAGMQPYPGMSVQGNTGAQNGSVGMQPYGASEAPYANGQPYGTSEAPYANGQPYGTSEAPYANGQPYGTAEAPYASGQAQGGGYAAANPYEPYGTAVQPKSSRKALVIIGMIVGLIVTIAVILLVVLLTRDNSHRTYQQAVGVFMDGLKRQDMEKMAEAFPERIQEELRRDMTRFYGSEREYWEEYNEELEWYCGKNVKTTYEIVSAEPLLDYQIEDYEKDCLEDFRYDVSITDGYSVELEVTFKGSEGEYSADMELDVVRIGGKWYVIGY